MTNQSRMSGNAGKLAEMPPPARKQEPADRVGALSAQLRDSILQAAPEIIQGLIQSAKGGNHLPAKYLFELAGIDAAPCDNDEQEHEASLSEILLRELENAKPDATS